MRARTVFGALKPPPFFDAHPFASPAFYKALEAHLEKNPHCKTLIGPIYTLRGYGWSMSLEKTNYGLTLSGIKHCLKSMEHSLPVVASLKEFHAFRRSCKLNQPHVLIVERSAFNGETDACSLHVFACVYEKKAGRELLTVYDSLAETIDFDKSLKALAKHSMRPDSARQKSGEETCHAYAIKDAMLLSKKIKARAYYHPKQSATSCFALEKVFSYDAMEFKSQLFQHCLSISDSLVKKPSVSRGVGF